jgi:outer membrane protein assembly factor BamB
MLALSAVDGSRLWAYDSGQRITSSPWVAEGVVFCANHAGHVFALSAGK